MIQIVRLLDEALTNAVKHADARRITVSIETLTEQIGPRRRAASPSKTMAGVLRPPPDGDAAAAGQKAARGLRNMRSRAARCGAELELASGAAGTRVRLTLPRRFPDSDAAAG